MKEATIEELRHPSWIDAAVRQQDEGHVRSRERPSQKVSAPQDPPRPLLDMWDAIDWSNRHWSY